MATQNKKQDLTPSSSTYMLAQGVSSLLAKGFFGLKYVRNEIKDAEGPYVIIANHQASLDFVNLIGATKKKLNFVLSNSFYSTLPIQGILDSIKVLPKQQFQTSVSDLKKMKRVVDNGGSLVIYPAGLMCEDGISTPIPDATFRFLKWLGVDVYVARTTGSYFCMPKWTGGIRKGTTLMDIYKLFSREELADATESDVKEKVNGALLFDAYREQDEHRFRYSNCDDIRGLENVLYVCPHCGSEFTISVRDKNTLCCSACGFEEKSDEFGMLHNEKAPEEEIRYVSDWSRMIYQKRKAQLEAAPDTVISCETVFRMIDKKKHKFIDAGEGTVTLDKDNFTLRGTLYGEEVDIIVPAVNLPTLPFSPGKHFEVQSGNTIYRCALKDGKQAMKFINTLKAFYELRKRSV